MKIKKWFAATVAAAFVSVGMVTALPLAAASAHSPSTSVITTNGQYPHKPDKPAPVVKYGEWGSDNLNCQNMVVTHTRKVYTYDWFWLFNQWVMNPIPNISSQTETVREATDRECGIIPPQPKDKITKTEWVDEAWECGATTTEQTREVTTTPYVWNEEEWAWVLDEENASTVTKTRTRDLTKDEWKTCPKPEPIVVTTHNDEPPVCEADNSWWIVVQHWTQVTTDWVLNDSNQWVKGEPVVKKWDSRQQVDNEGKPCPAVTETPTPTDTATPTPTDTATPTPTDTSTAPVAPTTRTTQPPMIGTAVHAELPYTGANTTPLLLAGFGLMMLGGGLTYASKRYSRQH